MPEAGRSPKCHQARPAGRADCANIGAGADGDQQDGEHDCGDLAPPHRSYERCGVSDGDGGPVEARDEPPARVRNQEMDERPAVEVEGVARVAGRRAIAEGERGADAAVPEVGGIARVAGDGAGGRLEELGRGGRRDRSRGR